MALQPGDTLLQGKYRIVRQLGRGGFGFVYLAQETTLNEEVAVKELIPALVGDEAVLKRFLAEARATHRLVHKCIVRTHDVFAERGNYYIVMQYMPGGSLEVYLAQRGKLPVEEALRIAADVCDGLACAHADGVVHCDLKPSNILLDAAGRARVADFGIAHISREKSTRSWLTPQGFVAGTLPYMSPEQTRGVRDDPRLDLYAVGAVLYRMLTGRTYLDFQERETPDAQAQNVLRIQNQEARAPSVHNPRVPLWLDRVVLKALAKRPEARYANAGELRAALFHQEPAVIVPAPPPPMPVRPPPAHPKPVPPPKRRQQASLPAFLLPLLGALVLALLVTMIAVATLGGRRGSIPSSAPQPSETQVLSPATAVLPSPGVGSTWTRPADRMVMVSVPAGEFPMGSSDAELQEAVVGCVAQGFGSESNCRSWMLGEVPQHRVTLDAFWIDRSEVSNAQYRRCVEAGACRRPTACTWGEPTYDDSAKADHPVACLSWDDAQAYCRWAGARLPTEAEWEKAARGADGRTYPWGNTFDGSRLNVCDQNCDSDWRDPSADDGYARTAPVDSYPAGISPYGVLDMAGNVWEWVNDW